MDPFSLEEDVMNAELFWAFSPEPLDFTPPVPALPTSAFVPFVNDGVPQIHHSGSNKNIHRRVVRMLKSIPKRLPEVGVSGEESKGFRHMMRERQRREKLSQSYADLYSMISSRTKADKNSIVQSATVHVKEMIGVKEKLWQRNEELRRKLAARGTADARGEKVKIRVADPSTAIDSMIAALRCLKSKGVKATGFQFGLSDDELSAVLNVDQTSKEMAAKLERSVEEALMEVGQEFRAPFPPSTGWFQRCHV